jgi:hypothetical protein
VPVIALDVPLSEAHFRSTPRASRMVIATANVPTAHRDPVCSAPHRIRQPDSRRRQTPGALVRSKAVLGGLRHECSMGATPVLP